MNDTLYRKLTDEVVSLIGRARYNIETLNERLSEELPVGEETLDRNQEILDAISGYERYLLKEIERKRSDG